MRHVAGGTPSNHAPQKRGGMRGDFKQLDPVAVADIAARIAKSEEVLVALRATAHFANDEVRGEECRLSNLKTALTNAVAGHLDDHVLPARKRIEVVG